jgi:formate--tetrahydrofolate ligase
VATVRALKYNGGVPKTELTKENIEALTAGLPNLRTHIENMKKYGVPVVVAINRFYADTEAEIAAVKDFAESLNVPCEVAEVFAKGGEGGIDLAQTVVKTIAETESNFAPLYDETLPIKEKIAKIASEIYRADGVIYTAKSEKAIAEITKLGFDKTPVCIAKTQYSLSDDPAKLCAPKDFDITVRDVKLSSGAGFVVALTGDIMVMPGLPKTPAAEIIDCDNSGKISGLF